MTIVYLYTALCTVGGADRSIIQKANYLADEMHQDVFIITDSQKERPPVFPISPRVRHIDIAIDFDRQYHHNLLVRGCYYFTLMRLYRKKLNYWLKTLKPDIGPRIGFSDTTGRWKRKNRRIPYSQTVHPKPASDGTTRISIQANRTALEKKTGRGCKKVGCAGCSDTE